MRRRFCLSILVIIYLVIVVPGVVFAQEENQSPGALQLRSEIAEAKASRQRPLRPNDTCIVCGMKLDSGSGMALSVRGRHVPVGDEVYEELLRDPEKYFSTLQPKGALFTESAVRSRAQISWLAFGVAALSLVACCAYLAALAVRKKMDSFGKIPQGLTKIPSTPQPVDCEVCKAENHPCADQCWNCGKELDPNYEPEVHRT